jgi:antitoxin VapB
VVDEEPFGSGRLGALGKSMSGLRPCPLALVPFHLFWYHFFVALNIKDPETERLAAEVAALTGTTKTGAVRYALRQVLQSQSRLSIQQREERLTRFLEEEIWPLVPPDQLGKPVSKAEREEILGFGEHGA